MKTSAQCCVDVNGRMYSTCGLIRGSAHTGLTRRSFLAQGLNTFCSLDMLQSDKCNDSVFFSPPPPSLFLSFSLSKKKRSGKKR